MEVVASFLLRACLRRGVNLGGTPYLQHLAWSTIKFNVCGKSWGDLSRLKMEALGIVRRLLKGGYIS